MNVKRILLIEDISVCYLTEYDDKAVNTRVVFFFIKSVLVSTKWLNVPSPSESS